MRWLRVGAIGAFFTGILSVIQGCDSREGVLILFALFALNFCSGPGTDTGGNSPAAVLNFNFPVLDDVCVLSTTELELLFGVHDGEVTVEGDISLGTVEQVRAAVESLGGSIICRDGTLDTNTQQPSPLKFASDHDLANSIIPEGNIIALGRLCLSFPWGDCDSNLWNRDASGRARIPYVISGWAPNSTEYQNILDAVELWNKAVPTIYLTNYDASVDGHYIDFDRGDIDASKVGRYQLTILTLTSQPISLSPTGVSQEGVIAHEIGHAIGLYHEHNRSDRDDRIEVLRENIADDQLWLFNLKSRNSRFIPNRRSAPHGSYDFQSIMHYGATAGARRDCLARGAQSCITMRGKNGETLGGMQITEGDIQAVLAMYPGTISPNPSVGTGEIYWAEGYTEGNYVNAGKIRRADLDGSDVEDLITGLDFPHGLVTDLVNGKLYWVEGDVLNSKIRRADLDGSNVEDFITGLIAPRSLKIDAFNQHLYWVKNQEPGGTIERIDLDGTDRVALVALWGPSALALDIGRGKIYWSQHLQSGQTQSYLMQRANLDGSDIEDLIVSTGYYTNDLVAVANSLQIDASAGKMYWGGFGYIRRANLDGSDIEELLYRGANPGSLDISDSTMYWVELAEDYTYSLFHATLNGTNVNTILSGISSIAGIAIVKQQ